MGLVALHIDAGARSDVGLVRKNNEDAYRVEPTLDLYVLCDGMGGEAHGEVASTMAVEAVVTHCLEAQNNLSAPLFGEPRADLSEASNRLASAVTLANRKIFEEAAANPLRQRNGHHHCGRVAEKWAPEPGACGR